MAPLTIDLRGITPDLLRSTDSSALTDAVQEAINPTQPMTDGAGFESRLEATHVKTAPITPRTR